MPYRDPEERREHNRLLKADLYAERSTRGLCVRCGTAAVAGRKMCVYCLVRDVGYTRKRRMKEIRDAARQKKESVE